jgi:cell volume regulation protein A
LLISDGGAALSILTAFVVLIIIGLILSGISRKLRTSNILLLIIAGLIIGHFFSEYHLFNISKEAILTIAILTLVLVVFDGSSRFKIKSLDKLSFPALKLSGLFLSLNLIFITLITMFLFFEFTLESLFYSLAFASIISGTDPASVFVMLKNKSSKVLEFLKIEGILNTPIIVLIPFILIDVLNQIINQTIVSIESHITAILTQILVGIGSGIVVGLIFFKGMKKFSEQTSGLSLVCSALLAFILAENVGGNGVLAVAVLGFMFGAFYISKKEILQEFSEMLSNSLEILVFIIIGLVVTINIDLTFILKSLVIFIMLIITRFLAIIITLKNENYTTNEMIYMTLVMPKGIAVAVLIVALSIINNTHIEIINNLLVAIIIYSVTLSTIINKFSYNLINTKVE